MSVYKTKAFARKAGLTDAQLAAAAALVVEGRCDADLGGGVYKQRVARAGGGKSGEFRTLLAFPRRPLVLLRLRLRQEGQGERHGEGAGGVAGARRPPPGLRRP